MSPKRDADATVYSSERGRMCPHCGLTVKRCVCRKNPRGSAEPIPDGDGIVRVRREKKGRKGKTVTTLTGIPLPANDLEDLAKALKQRCGTGGTVKDGVIEIQGDHCDVLITELQAREFVVKRAGG
jgi:translation initiation factor 1